MRLVLFVGQAQAQHCLWCFVGEKREKKISTLNLSRQQLLNSVTSTDLKGKISLKICEEFSDEVSRNINLLILLDMEGIKVDSNQLNKYKSELYQASILLEINLISQTFPTVFAISLLEIPTRLDQIISI